MKILRDLLRKITKENPVFVLLLGMCPILATTTSVVDAFGMGICIIIILICSNCMISLLKKLIPGEVRIAAFILIISSFVAAVELVMQAFFMELNQSLGLFIPLITVNCAIFGRAEAFASKNSVFDSFIDGLGMGAGFTAALIILASAREILGNGTFMNFPLLGDGFQPALMAILPPGGFIILGIILGVIKLSQSRKAGA